LPLQGRNSFQRWKNKDLIKVEALKEFGEFVQEMWIDIIPLTIEEAFTEKNAETRRVYSIASALRKLSNSKRTEL
jgi:hypothetical protein